MRSPLQRKFFVALRFYFALVAVLVFLVFHYLGNKTVLYSAAAALGTWLFYAALSEVFLPAVFRSVRTLWRNRTWFATRPN